ncbi:CHAD domain-containing protein [Synechocystis sp. PCC 7509]|uniref:CHAD domain-containing protein n=1 Tax=Synechocystis sp. PCC 7509 TaxID=927677 RepID=UPI0002ACAD68|nr:CHAD domain-containing protein [Synechocystis sp. PCC 7509]
MVVSDQKTQLKTLGDWASMAIAKHLQKIVKHEKDVLTGKSPEDLHQMRVGMRRLRSAIAGFSPALQLPKAATERKVSKIARILGSLRDLDVLGAALENNYKPSLPAQEQKYLETALVDIKKQRRYALAEVKETIAGKKYKLLKESLNQWLQQPEYQEIAKMPMEEVLPDLLLPEVSKLLLHPGWLVGSDAKIVEVELVEKILAKQGEFLHSLRKETKRLRYQMEVFSEFYGESYASYLEDIKAIQEILGKIQDSNVLTEFLTQSLPDNIRRSIPTLVAELAKANYDAWQQWQNVQTKYLSIDVRKGFHIAILEPNLKW